MSNSSIVLKVSTDSLTAPDSATAATHHRFTRQEFADRNSGSNPTNRQSHQAGSGDFCRSCGRGGVKIQHENLIIRDLNRYDAFRISSVVDSTLKPI